ncbi:MAG TPA: HupE/UreJ family protein, partial [Thermoanaerobaculia bacterium]|nr:HupE/UreJ family protein [Thermoanaerobaculia bacterium]
MPFRPLFRGLILVLLISSAAPVAWAHELGTIQVTATFEREGTWRVAIAIDEEHIPPVTVARPGETRFGPIAGLTPPLRARLGAFLSALADRSALAFDGRTVTPERISVDLPPPPADDPFAPPPKVTLHLTGATPPGAHAASFSTTLPLRYYPIAYQNAGDEMPTRRWQEAGKTGAPFGLDPRVVPPSRATVVRRFWSWGYTQVLPRGVGEILFLLGVFLLSTALPVPPVLPVLPTLARQTVTLAAAQTLALAAGVSGAVSLSLRLTGPALGLTTAGLALWSLLSGADRARRCRFALVFACGLVHGLAFAGALRALGLPRRATWLAVSSFDLGVLAAEMTVLAAAFLLLGPPWNRQPWY